MANVRRTPGSDDEPIESRRTGLDQADAGGPMVPDEEGGPAPDGSDFGEFAPEAARPSPLDDIAEAEREKMPRD